MSMQQRIEQVIRDNHRNATDEMIARAIAPTIEELKDRCWYQADVPAAMIEACYLYRRGLITAEETELLMNEAEGLYLAAAK